MDKLQDRPTYFNGPNDTKDLQKDESVNPYPRTMNGGLWWFWFAGERLHLNQQIIDHCNKIGKGLEGREECSPVNPPKPFIVYGR